MQSIVQLDRLTPRALAILGDTLDGLLRADLDAGRAELWAIDGGESYAITRLEVDANELVVCAYAGRGLRDFARHVYRQCARRGVSSIRWHTRRPALARMLADYAPAVEYVYRVRVAAQERAA